MLYSNSLELYIRTGLAIYVALLATVYIIGIMLTDNKKIIYNAALYAVALAEDKWNTSKMGKIKFAEVYTYIKKKYPIITMFFSEKQMTEIIENALTELKNILKESTESLVTESQTSDDTDLK